MYNNQNAVLQTNATNAGVANNSLNASIQQQQNQYNQNRQQTGDILSAASTVAPYFMPTSKPAGGNVVAEDPWGI
jgi:hypothetical protein